MKGPSFIIRMSFIAGLLHLNATPAAAQHIFICRHAVISFFSEAPIENIEAETGHAVSALNIDNHKIYFKVPIRTFRFEKSLMQEHFNENFMESDKYPYAVFNGNFTGNIHWEKPGKYNITAKGTLIIHGISRPYHPSGSIIITADSISLSSHFIVRLADHDISIPKILFKNIADKVSVSVEAVYHPQKEHIINQ